MKAALLVGCSTGSAASPVPYLHVAVVLWHVDESGQTLAEPHGDVAVHVDGEGLEALLQAAHGVVFKGACVLAQVHAADLRQTQAAHRNETWKSKKHSPFLLYNRPLI